MEDEFFIRLLLNTFKIADGGCTHCIINLINEFNKITNKKYYSLIREIGSEIEWINFEWEDIEKDV